MPKGDRKFNGKSADGTSLFKCKKGSGVLVDPNELTRELSLDSKPVPVPTEEVPSSLSQEEGDSDLDSGDNDGSFECGDEVVWIDPSADRPDPERGTVKWIGVLPGPGTSKKLGIEFVSGILNVGCVICWRIRLAALLKERVFFSCSYYHRDPWCK